MHQYALFARPDNCKMQHMEAKYDQKLPHLHIVSELKWVLNSAVDNCNDQL
jgi:hypothetical protein